MRSEDLRSDTTRSTLWWDGNGVKWFKPAADTTESLGKIY